MLNFVVALPCEASPIIIYYKLKKLSTILPIFANRDKTIHLIIAGVGKIKMAIATTFLSTFTGRCSFLNVGIAGSKHLPIGQVVLANKITEQSTNRHWYPFTASLKKIPQNALITYDVKQQEYPHMALIDMEGSAFFQTTSTFVAHEQIQLLKIISDNNLADQEKITPTNVKNLIANNLSDIDYIATYLKELTLCEQHLAFNHDRLIPFQNKWHFTHHQTLQLKEYLRRWYIFNPNEDPFIFSQNEKNAAQVIKKIMLKLEIYANDLY